MKKSLLLLAVVALLSSCDGLMAPFGKKLVTDSVQVVRGDSLVTMNIVWVKTAKPEWLADSLNKAIVRQLFNQESSDVRVMAEAEATSFYKEYQADKVEREAYEDAYAPEWERDVTLRLDNETTHFYNFVGSEYVFLGGAHGGFTAHEFSVDKQTGETLSWEQLFLNPDDENLAALVRTSIESQYFEEQMDFEFFIDGDKFPLPASPPAVRKEGILFQYQQYEIASYADGLPACVISYDELMPYLRPEIIEKLPRVDAFESAADRKTTWIDRLRSLFKK